MHCFISFSELQVSEATEVVTGEGDEVGVAI